jgi:2-phosphosulfolactate phosphatase
MKKTAEVILSPLLINSYDIKDKIVVVIDVFRATTSICVALESQFKSIITTLKIEDAIKLKKEHNLIAGERDGNKLEGFDIGNSPSEIINYKNSIDEIVLTSTNGTKCIELAYNNFAKEIWIGSLNNVGSIAEKLNKTPENVVFLCAGWKNKANVEDTFMAGKCLNEMKENFDINSDSCFLAMRLATGETTELLRNAEHYMRLKEKGNLNDLEICMQINTSSKIPKVISFSSGIAYIG